MLKKDFAESFRIIPMVKKIVFSQRTMVLNMDSGETADCMLVKDDVLQILDNNHGAYEVEFEFATAPRILLNQLTWKKFLLDTRCLVLTGSVCQVTCEPIIQLLSDNYIQKFTCSRICYQGPFSLGSLAARPVPRILSKNI